MKATTSFKRALTIASLSLAGYFLPTPAQAVQLTYDLRVVSSSGGETITDPHQLTIQNPGEVLTLNLYAIVQGLNTDLTQQGFIGGQGSLNASGNLLGTFRGDTVGQAPTLTNNVAPFAYSLIAQSGYNFDFDGDTIADDLGSDITTGSPTPLPFFVANSDKNSGIDPYTGTGTGSNGAQFLIGQFQFTITGGGASANLAFVPRVKASGAGTALHKIFVDGSPVSLQGTSAQIATIGVNIAIPEPSAIGMLLLGSVGLIGFRRSAFRHLVS